MLSATSLAIKLVDHCRLILTVIMPMYVNVRKNPFLVHDISCISIVSRIQDLCDLIIPPLVDFDYLSVCEQTLGHTAYYLAQAGVTGYLATVANLKQDVSEWRCGGAPFTVSGA